MEKISLSQPLFPDKIPPPKNASGRPCKGENKFEKISTYCNLPTQLTHGISVAARCGLSATLFLIGGGLSIEVIRKVGLKPLVLGIILWAVISVASLAVILLL